MRRRNKDYGKIINNVEVVDFAAEGFCISKLDGKVIFTKYTAPGDVVDLMLLKSKKNFAEAKVINYIKKSDKRIEPVCKHFGDCGGCKFQHIPYDVQLTFKEQQVKDALERIGKVAYQDFRPIIGSEANYNYRNKMEFTFSNKRWLTEKQIQSEENFEKNGLGFHVPGLFDKVIDIEHCYLQEGLSNDIRNYIRDYALKNNLSFYDIRNHEGFLRTLMVRMLTTGQIMILVQFAQLLEKEINDLLTALQNKYPEITSIVYVINTKKNDTFHDLDVITFAGPDYIEEEMEGLTFRINPKSFYQTNSNQAYILYKVAREMAGLTGNELVYDFYTGTGTIANFVAKNAKHVIGVEYVDAAIEDAKVNADINSITNTTFLAGDMKDVFNEEFIQKYGRADVIITDPPRAGMHEDVINVLLKLECPKIVYISCNPSTQARDLQLLANKYDVKSVQPVDMFPQTHHVENVVLLELKS